MQPLKVHRAMRGLSVRQLAERAGVQKDTITRLEHGGRAYLTTMYKVAQALNITPQEITEFSQQIQREGILPTSENSASAPHS